ncbi:hypothetical protein AKO1_015524 [Acrasis kona]|uniref:Dynein heavy chain C-terminal domain-containing protein n=1 Tax=Acrasis kona TaxID=1008807 RepID=A0AAW2YLY8_9EUKA
MDTIISIQPRSATAGSGQSRNNSAVLSMVDEFVSKLPPALSNLPSQNKNNSLTVFLSQEISQFDRLLNVIRKSLLQLKRAINGLVVMSEDLEEMYNCLLYQSVPPVWSRVAYPSRKPLSTWFLDLLDRVKFIKSWIENGEPDVFWIGAFFFPQGFLTSVLQMHSRKHKIAIDQLQFKTEVMSPSSKLKSKPESGVYIRGLYMEGARWDADEGCIQESKKGELSTVMPVIWLKPITNVDAADDEMRRMRKSKSGKIDVPKAMYECPVYKTGERAGSLSTTGLSTNFVLSVQLDAGKHDTHHWTQRAVALLTMIDN